MKTKSLLMFSSSILALALIGCNVTGGSSSKKSSNKSSNNSSSGVTYTSAPGTSSSITNSDSHEWNDQPITGDFSLLNADGEASGYTVSNSVYTINTAGTYTLEGKLEGRIEINAADQTVELDLNGVEITSSDNSPIYATSLDKLKVKAMEGTSNKIIDNRAAKTTDVDTQGEGAIAGKCDMNFIGSGELQVEGNYNNGIHTSKDLKIKNVQLKSYGYQHALRGGNSIEVSEASTYISAIAKTGDGFKSNDAGTTSKGKQKGTISFLAGTINVQAFNDGVDAAYNAVIGVEGDATANPVINISTEIYADLTKSITRPGPGGGGGPGGDPWNEGNTNKSSTTAKGIKAANEIYVYGGQVTIKAYDDAFHANHDALTDSDDVATGVTGLGNINVSGGTIYIECSDDGFHADNTLTISGGKIDVKTSYEALEGNIINISGGETRVFGSDDGMNAAGDLTTPSITVSGGFLEVAVSPNSDVDGIDSNGTFLMTGGVVISKGPNSGMASALDHEGRATLNGGTIVVLGAIENMSNSSYFSVASSMTKYNLSLHSSGSHTLTVSGTSYSFTNSYSYAKTVCYSDVSVSGN